MSDKKARNGRTALTTEELKEMDCPFPPEPDPYLPPKAYSGEQSQEFWDIINALPDKHRWTAYSLGVALQNIESNIRRLIRVQINESEQTDEEDEEDEGLDEAWSAIGKLIHSAGSLEDQHALVIIRNDVAKKSRKIREG